MNFVGLERKFQSVGARLKLNRLAGGAFRIDVRDEGRGECFDIGVDDRLVLDIQALDVRPAERHLLLMAKTRDRSGVIHKDKFLCGHDERHWFVAAVPEVRGVSNVRSAMETLKPTVVRVEQDRQRVKHRRRNRRRNAAFVRQGEWFFVPCPDLDVNLKWVLKNEPLRRGAGKPHWCELLCRRGGESVYVSREYPNGVTLAEYRKLVQSDPSKLHLRWNTMIRNPEVYVKGRISHADHKTVVLRCWHRVQMNTETQSRAMRHVAFLD